MRIRTAVVVLLAMLPWVTSATWASSVPPDEADIEPLHYASHVSHGRHLLAYDDTGDGRIVEIFGSADARRIAVLVPGASHTLDSYDSDTADSLAIPARALLHELRQRAPDESVAVIAWLGYDTPDGVNLAAMRTDRAAAAAPDLARLSRSLPSHADISLVCHSYGSVVCGHAADSAGATDLVVLGSPGLGVDHAAELDTPATIWAAIADADTTAFVPNVRVAGFGHGADPTSPEFGARSFALGDIRGHSRYYEPGSESLANVARIVLGRYDAVTTPQGQQ